MAKAKRRWVYFIQAGRPQPTDHVYGFRSDQRVSSSRQTRHHRNDYETRIKIDSVVFKLLFHYHASTGWYYVNNEGITYSDLARIAEVKVHSLLNGNVEIESGLTQYC